MASIVDSTTMSDNHVDDHVDVEIQQCLNAVPPKSFFMIFITSSFIDNAPLVL